MAQRRADAPRGEDWTILFVTGYDFFSELEPHWHDATIMPPIKFALETYAQFPAIARPEPEDKQFIAAAESAWRQFGPKVMERWNKAHHPAGDRELPEAFIRFGDPGKLR